MAKLRKKIIEFPNNIPTPGSAFLYAKKNPNGSYTTSNYTYEQLITLLNSELTPGGGGGGSLLHSNVYFVDYINGNDSTGTVGDATKPYATINGAINAANATGYYVADTFRGLIHVRHGVYNELVFLQNFIDIYFEPGTVMYGSFRDNGASINSRIFGGMIFRGTTGLFVSGLSSNVYLEFDYADVSGAFFVGLSKAGTTDVYIKCNSINAMGIGYAYGNSIRGNVNLIMDIADYGNSVQTFMDVRNEYSGNLYIKAKNINLLDGDNYGIDFKQCLYIRHCDNANIRIDANLNNLGTGFSSIYGLVAATNVYDSTIEINGNIDGVDARAITYTASSATSILKYSGEITTTNEAMNIYGYGRLYIYDSIIRSESSKTDIFTFTETPTITINNLLVLNSLSSRVFYTLDDSVKLNLINVLAYNQGSAGTFAVGQANWNIHFFNVTSNINYDVTVTDIAVPTTGFKLDTTLTLY